MLSSIKKTLRPKRGSGLDDFTVGADSLSTLEENFFPNITPLPTTKKGSVDVETLYGATPEQMRAAGESYAAESRKILMKHAAQRSGALLPPKQGGIGGVFGGSPHVVENFVQEKQFKEERKLAYKYAAESRRLFAKADKLEKSLKRREGGEGGMGSDLYGEKGRVVEDIYRGINEGKITVEDAEEAVYMAEMAGEKDAARRRMELMALDLEDDYRYQRAGCCGMFPME